MNVPAISETKIDQIPTPESDVVAIDVELLGMERGKLHRPTGKFGSLAISDGRTVWVILQQDRIQPALDAVRDCTWVFHNAQFDIFHLRRWAEIAERPPGRFWDTMIWERILWSGYFDSMGLEDLARRYLDISLSKEPRKLFETYSYMTPKMLEYAEMDAFMTWHIYQAQRRELQTRPDADALLALWNDIEGPMLEVVLNFKGFLVSRQMWESVSLAYEKQRDKIKATLDFNPASPQQVRAALAKVGINVPSTAADVLEPYRDNEIVQRVLEFRKAAKLAGTYGRKFLEKHQEADGRIYSHYWTYGAQTGRMASSDPNQQNIPKSPEFRSGFVAAPGHKLIVADYSQQESRIAAAISNDEFLLDLFRRGEDIHLMVARQIYDDDTITKDDPRRFLGKTLNLAITYGLTAPSFAKRVTQWNHQRGIKQTFSTAEAQTLIDSYFRTCRGIRAYIDTQRLRGQREGRVTTRLGRVIHLNLYNDQWMNIAINAPIQGGAADQMKMALVSLFRECKDRGLEFPVVTVVHDEIVAEVPTEQTALYSDLIERCMLEAGERLYPEVVWKVGVAVGDNWGVKE